MRVGEWADNARPGANMKNEDRGGRQEQLEEHSLPGTNQAGKDIVPCEENDQEKMSGGAESPEDEQLEEHSLPGTNQAGEGPEENT
jgi:hypothetical protein